MKINHSFCSILRLTSIVIMRKIKKAIKVHPNLTIKFDKSFSLNNYKMNFINY
jgi:hypothetical protein